MKNEEPSNKPEINILETEEMNQIDEMNEETMR